MLKPPINAASAALAHGKTKERVAASSRLERKIAAHIAKLPWIARNVQYLVFCRVVVVDPHRPPAGVFPAEANGNPELIGVLRQAGGVVFFENERAAIGFRLAEGELGAEGHEILGHPLALRLCRCNGNFPAVSVVPG